MNIDLHYPGGKRRIAPWIVEKMPDHHSYLEPFFGCGAVLFEKEPARIETINDIDEEVVNFFRVVRNSDKRESCAKQLRTPRIREKYMKMVLNENIKATLKKRCGLLCGACSLMGSELLKKADGKKMCMGGRRLMRSGTGIDSRSHCST